MQIKELIKKLEKIEQEHGNVEVNVYIEYIIELPKKDYEVLQKYGVI